MLSCHYTLYFCQSPDYTLYLKYYCKRKSIKMFRFLCALRASATISELFPGHFLSGHPMHRSKMFLILCGTPVFCKRLHDCTLHLCTCFPGTVPGSLLSPFLPTFLAVLFCNPLPAPSLGSNPIILLIFWSTSNWFSASLGKSLTAVYTPV